MPSDQAEAWLQTQTRFTQDAIALAVCVLGCWYNDRVDQNIETLVGTSGYLPPSFQGDKQRVHDAVAVYLLLGHSTREFPDAISHFLRDSRPLLLPIFRLLLANLPRKDFKIELRPMSIEEVDRVVLALAVANEYPEFREGVQEQTTAFLLACTTHVVHSDAVLAYVKTFVLVEGIPVRHPVQDFLAELVEYGERLRSRPAECAAVLERFNRDK